MAYERPPRPAGELAPASPPAIEPVATVTDRQVTDWAEPRQGLHFGIGATLSPVPFSLTLMVKGHATYGFGRFGVDISPRIGITGHTDYGGGFGLCVDSQFRFAILPWLTAGAGLDLGLELGGFFSGFRSGPSFTFADVTLGDRGQHRLSLWATIPLLWTGSSYRAPFPLVTLAYAHMF